MLASGSARHYQRADPARLILPAAHSPPPSARAGGHARDADDDRRRDPLRPELDAHARDGDHGRDVLAPEHELGGQVLLLGVTFSESTMVHVAESIANVPYAVEHPCVVEVDGAAVQVMIAGNPNCCRGFRRLNDWLTTRGLVREGTVGNARAILADARDIVAVAVERLAEDAEIFLCRVGKGCEECDAARASIPASWLRRDGSI